MLRQALRFGSIGLLATFVHLSTGSILIYSGWSPLWANAVSFLFAFGVSLFGHLRFSFADHDTDVVIALRRFSVVALAGFLLNAVLLAALLSQTALPAMPAFVLTTSITAGLSFLVSRKWAFQPQQDKRSVTLGGLQ